MGITQSPAAPPARPSAGPASTAVSVGAYVVLFLLGLVLGLLGSFQYSRGVVGSVPVLSIAFALAILVTCTLAGWAMRSLPGALLPAIGWFVASFVLASPASNGSVVISNTSAGEWFLYGGSVCALLGVGSTFITTPRRTLIGTGARGSRNGPGA